MVNTLRKLPQSSIWTIVQKILNTNEAVYVFSVTVFFYIAIILASPGNKILVVLFVLLIFIYFLRLKDFYGSAVLGYIASSIVLTGKTYTLQLIPPGIFPMDRWPLGYIVRVVISPSHVLLGLMVFLIIFKLNDIRIRKLHLEPVVFLLLFYQIWFIVSDLFGSNQPMISVMLSFLFCIQTIYVIQLKLIESNKRVLHNILTLFVSLVVVESLLALYQFIQKSSIGISIESQTGIEFFGDAADELSHAFRPVGTFFHANDLALFLTVFLPIVGWYYGTKRSNFALIGIALGFVALILTLSRAGWLAFSINVLLYIGWYRNVLAAHVMKVSKTSLVLISVLCIILGLYFVLPRMEKTIQSFGSHEGGLYVRALQIENALSLALLHPVFGVGEAMSVPEGLKIDFTGVIHGFPSPVHNVFILRTAEHGFISGILITLLFISIFRVLLKYMRKVKDINSSYSVFSFSLLSSFISVFIFGLFHPIRIEHFMILLVPFVCYIEKQKTLW